MIERIALALYFVWRVLLLTLALIGWIIGMVLGTVAGGVWAGLVKGFKG